MPEITWAQREKIAERNRRTVERELLEKRLVFASRPYEAHVQFSTVCNMSCIMCWDGENPPAKRMSPALLEKLATQVAPDLSVITPHEASEPTVVTWEDTVRIAQEYSVQLMLTTNVQEFDEEKFHQVKDHLEVVCMSIDSHVPEVFEKIRLGGKADKVFRNAATIARLCREHEIECIGQAVFMTENAAAMPETVVWFAEMGVQFVSVTQMIDTNRRSWHLDASLHLSAEYIDWIKNKCIAAARENKVRLAWYISGYEMYDFREDGAVGPNASKAANERFEDRMRLRHPGFCRFAYHRLRVETVGNVSPCGMDSHHELQLGNLEQEDFDAMWNGPTAQDLRRAHYTGDYPSLCKTCRFTDPPAAAESLPFFDVLLWQTWRLGRGEVEPALAVEEPEHMYRHPEAPAFRMRPDRELESYLLLLSLGGEPADAEVLELDSFELEDGSVWLELPEERWHRLRTNVGYWWTVLGVPPGATKPTVRLPEVRCMVRHEPIARIEGSALKYQDEGHFSVIYLGGNRESGFSDRGKLPTRPPLKGTGATNVVRNRFAKLRKAPDADPTVARMTPEAYGELKGHIREVASVALPPGASVLVATKGDPELLDLGGATGWHFPCDASREYAGFHPSDSDWAIGHLERMRAEGAEFLLLPATVHWWLDHYPELAAHLREHYEAIVDDEVRCTIFDLRGVRSAEPVDAGADHDVALT